MKTELTLREIQIGELGVLKKIKEICTKANIDYFLMWGTLIGAIRHKGIIPWDDDIDIGMLRPEYERFILYCQKNEKDLFPYKLYHYTTHKKYIYPIARFVDTRYIIDYNDTVDYNLGLFVDVYPFDGCGNSLKERDNTFKAVRGNLLPYISLGVRTNVLFNHGVLNYCVKTVMWVIAKMIGQNWMIKRIDERAKRVCDVNSLYVNCIIWDTTHSLMFPQIAFKELIEVPFENDFFKIPKGYDEILKLEYGDYMQLPPEGERIGHHYYKAYRKE